MLQAIRDKVTGWIAYGIIFLISIPFALWGVNSYLGGGEAVPAASVNGEEITVRELDQAYANYRQRLTQLFGGNIPDSFGSEAMLKEQVLGQLIEEYALRQYAENRRYRIGDVELNRMIQSRQEFQRDGRFDLSLYQAQLRSQGYSPLSFEQLLRRTQSMDQLRSGILATGFTVESTEKQFTGLISQSRKIRSLVLGNDSESIEVEMSDIEAHYKTHAARYSTPEQVKIDYIELSLDKVMAAIVVDDSTVQERYQASLESYTTPESREASHILIKADETASGDDDPALAQIRQIRERIVNGEKFADLARELSQDPGSAADGGNLGDIDRGVMVQSFEAALFALQLDEISEPVKTSFGWHLIQLHAISGGEVRSYESMKPELENEIKTELAESQIFDLVENLANLVYEQPDSLLPAAEQLNLQVQTSDWFNRGSGVGIAADPKIRQLAFSQDVLQQGLNSEAIELSDQRVVFIRLNQFKEATPRSLQQVEADIRAELITLESRRLNQEKGEQAVEALRQGKSLDDLAQDWSVSVKDHGFVKRNQPDMDGSVLRKAFSMNRPDQGLVYDGLALVNGDYRIIELSAVISNDANADQEAIDRLASSATEAEYQSVLRLLSERAEVVRSPVEEL